MALPTALLVKGGIGATTVALGGVAIAKREDIYYFFNPNNNRELNEKIKALGISGCELGNGKTSKTCTLDKAKLEKITFVKGETEAKASGEDISAELTIEKLTEDSFKTDFPEGLRFTFKNTKEADLTLGSNGNTITLKKDVGYDFKIKNGTKLEKAWTQKSLGEKVGISCNDDNTTSCTIKTEGINVWKENSGVTNATTTETSKQVSVTKDQKDYLDGLKFTVSEDIALTVSGGNNSGINKLTKTSTNNTSYEIALKDHNGTKTWFLVEKDTTPS